MPVGPASGLRRELNPVAREVVTSRPQDMSIFIQGFSGFGWFGGNFFVHPDGARAATKLPPDLGQAQQHHCSQTDWAECVRKLDDCAAQSPARWLELIPALGSLVVLLGAIAPFLSAMVSGDSLPLSRVVVAVVVVAAVSIATFAFRQWFVVRCKANDAELQCAAALVLCGSSRLHYMVRRQCR